MPNGIAAQNDVQHLGVLQQLRLERVFDHPVRRQQRERGDLRPFQACQQVILAEARDRGDEYEDLGQHHEDDGEDQKAP